MVRAKVAAVARWYWPRPRARATVALSAILAATPLAACGGTADGPAAADQTTGAATAATVADGQGVAAPKDSARIAIFEVAEVPVFDELVAGFEDGFLKTSGLSADQVEFDRKNAQGDNSLIQNFARDLPRGDYDMFAVIGTPAVIALAKQEQERPIIAVSMTDPVAAGVAQSLERPGSNVTGTSDAVPPEEVASFLSQIKPKPSTVGTIIDPSNPSSSNFVKTLRRQLDGLGIELVDAAITGPGDIAAAARSVAGRVDMIVLTADPIVAGEGLPTVAETARSQRIPLIVAAGVDPSTPGVLATLSPDNHELGELSGELAGRIFLGADPAEEPFELIRAALAVNSATLKDLDVTLPESVQ